jgi:L-alanine-DL-glutamate epimerase-like enolase superfamily enzyme
MQITALDFRACRLPEGLPGPGSLRDRTGDRMECVVYTMRTADGQEASMLGFAGRSARGAAETASASLRPFFMGRNAQDRETAWHDWRRADRWWHHLPGHAYGPVDCCLWLLAAQAAEQPLWRYIGGARDKVPVYASSLVLPDAAAYADEARAVQAAGLRGYKIHPPGRSLGEDIAIHGAVRQAVGDDFALMSDPVQPYTFDEALRLGRALEALGYLWLEEPLPDEASGALAELTRRLDIAVIGGEVLAKRPYALADYCARRVVDGVRADVSWSGGVTGTLKTAHLAEAFHMPCEIHTAIFHPLEMVNLHVCGAIHNSAWFEVLWPMDRFSFALPGGLPITDGMALLPQTPGLGAPLDLDMIENATLEMY